MLQLEEALMAEKEAKEAEELSRSRMEEAVRMADDRVEEVALSARTEAAERAVQTAESLRIGLSLETAMQLKEQLADSERKRSETSIALEKLESTREEQVREMHRLQTALHEKEAALREAEEAVAELSRSRSDMERKAHELKEASAMRLRHLQSQCSEAAARAVELERKLLEAQSTNKRDLQESWQVEQSLRAQIRDAQERATHEQKNCEHLKWELENTQKQETANKQEAVRYQEELQKQRDALNAEQEQALAAAASLAAAERASLQQGFQEAMKQAEQQMETQKQALKAELMARHSAQQLEATTEERKSLERTLECLRASQHEAIAALKAERVKHEEEMKAKEEEAQQRERAVELLMKLNQETLEVSAKACFSTYQEVQVEGYTDNNSWRSSNGFGGSVGACLQREHASALADQEKEHQAEKSLLQSRMSTIEKEMEEQQRHLDRRPSRQEDLETIDALTKALKDANESVTQREEIVRRLKLELVNSDRTYNKVFGSDPKAGLVNPLERPNIQSRARRSTGSFMASSQTALRRGSLTFFSQIPRSSSIGLPP
ncbi:hypothetical protein cyc_06356 [Cyclospora cayetanensis]|uniref:Uncharacterized protein n=1 Tax=Cyclospora cayetanensis TaxID=88456 RepID=A0A1D3DAQ3_9EIME|nr:hypothetical protein cyc_06356 [Cyclospora cayetanensis]